MMYGGGTSISGAIDYSVTLFPQSPFKSERHVIDISGDGSNNRGRPVTHARDEAVAAGIVINGLPILAFEPYLDQYFKDYVIGGPGAFMIAAKSFETFAEAILMKLIIEIADLRRAASRLARRRFSTPAPRCPERKGGRQDRRLNDSRSYVSAADRVRHALLGEAVLGGAGELLLARLGVARLLRLALALGHKLFAAAPASFCVAAFSLQEWA